MHQEPKDRFGRTPYDTPLVSSCDKNGNPILLEYPGGVKAVYTYDYADRPAPLQVQDGVNPAQTVVSTASYNPPRSLATLTLGNGLTENHAFTHDEMGSVLDNGKLTFSYDDDRRTSQSATSDLDTMYDWAWR